MHDGLTQHKGIIMIKSARSEQHSIMKRQVGHADNCNVGTNRHATLRNGYNRVAWCKVQGVTHTPA